MKGMDFPASFTLLPVNAEIIAVGSELLTPRRQDSNSLYLTEKLNDLGVEVRFKCVVGDDAEGLAAAAKLAMRRSDIIIFSGGLGPTEDDLTREAVADALGLKLQRDAAIIAKLEERFAKRFGSAFLMPASGVRARFDQIVGSESHFDVRELILLAHQFGVSTEAMCRRLEELTVLPHGTWDSIRDRGFASDLERSVVGEVSRQPKPPLIPPRLAYLAAIALERELLSEGQLCDLLAVDRLELREALTPFEAKEVISLHA